MKETIREILLKIEKLNADLREEYDRLAKEYGFSWSQRKVIFLDEFRKRNKKFRFPSWKYLIPRSKYLLYPIFIPFIYGVFFPTLLLDIFLYAYQCVVFSLLKIPKVNRSEYIIYDRRFLDYLNWIQKINCLYCSYVNGVFAYAVEVGGRTERYWCPIKAAHKPRFTHGWYKDFADYGNPEDWNQKFSDEERVFLDAYGDKCFTR